MPNYNITILLILLVIFSVSALSIFFKSFAGNSKLFMTCNSVAILSIVTLSYIFSGGFADFYNYQRSEQTKQKALTVLKGLQGPEELITKLEKHLEANPDSAKGWYLLGRVYASQNLSQQAQAAFSSAYRISPNDEKIVVNYAQSLLANNDLQGVSLLEELLIKNPTSQDSLAILAMYYYSHTQNSMAIKYWQRLLDILPQNSAAADDVRKIIAKIYQKD